MGVKIVLDCHNTEFQLFKDSLKFFSLPKRMIGEYLMPHIKDLEIEATRNADLILACSSSDAEYFKEYNPKTFVIPNGVDCSEFPATHDTTAPVLIFTGGVGYPPNADAMRFYLKEVHPIVKQEIPDVRLLAIGVAPEWLRSENITDASVTALGFVEAVQPYLREAAIGICPIRFGSGTRLKILTYMAAGLPVVSTSKGAEGIAYVNGRDILLRDEPAEFAAAIVELLKNSKLRDTIGQQGRVFVLQHYEWDIIGKQLQHLYHELT
jgi:glycosyltransferase involved in cell wall biosynthesis